MTSLKMNPKPKRAKVMMPEKILLAVFTLTILGFIQSSDPMILPAEAATSSRLEQRRSNAPVSRQTSPRTPTIIVPDFSVEITDVKYLGFQVNPSNSELGLHRDDGFHRIKVFWKQFSGCFSYTEDVQLIAKLILHDGAERVLNGKLNPVQDCADGTCFSTVVIPGIARDGSPARYDVQIIDAATFRAGIVETKTIGHFPQGPPEEIDVPPGAVAGSRPSGPGSINPSLTITNVEYAGLTGRIHTLRCLTNFPTLPVSTSALNSAVLQ
jgi:hypothetical protein